MERIKSLLKPLEDDTAIMVGRRKEMFPYEDELKQHLDCLGVPELSDRLVWIPFNRIQNATLLAQGGFSKAWKARIKLRKGGVVQQVVLKELDKSAIQQVLLSTILSGQSGMVTSEIYGLSGLPDSKKYLLVAQFLQGGSLEEWFKIPLHKAQPTWRHVLSMALELALGLFNIHDLGLTHSNLHPRNIIPGSLSAPKMSVIDIGLAKAIGISQYDDNQGHYGRLQYLPPEVFHGYPYTQASDVYCFGTMFWLIASHVPPRGTAAKLFRADRMREESVPDMPREMERIIFDCWNPNPEGRPTIDEVVQRMLKIQYVMEETRRDPQFSENTKRFWAERRREYLEGLAAEEKDDGFGFFNGGNSRLYAQSQYFTHQQLTAFIY